LNVDVRREAEMTHSNTQKPEEFNRLLDEFLARIPE